jgi:threonine dehydrogenase-like Zn-dependent dehydrogenase
MAVGRHAVARGSDPVQPVVLGAGPVAWVVANPAHRSGNNRGLRLLAADAVALAMGATAAVDPADEAPMDVWLREDGRRQPVVFDAIGVPGTLETVLLAAPMMGRVCVVGSCMQPDTVRPLVAQTKQLTVIFSFAYDPFEFGDTLRAIAEGEIDVTPMITGTCGIDGVPAAFEALGRPEGTREDPRRAGRTGRSTPV